MVVAVADLRGIRVFLADAILELIYGATRIILCSAALLVARRHCRTSSRRFLPKLGPCLSHGPFFCCFGRVARPLRRSKSLRLRRCSNLRRRGWLSCDKA